MKKQYSLLIVSSAFLSGCWAISDLRTNMEMDRALHENTPVESKFFRSKVPQYGLLVASDGEELRLREANLGLGRPEYFSVRFVQPKDFDSMLGKMKSKSTRYVTHRLNGGREAIHTETVESGRTRSTDIVGIRRGEQVILFQHSTFNSTFGSSDYWNSRSAKALLKFVEDTQVK